MNDPIAVRLRFSKNGPLRFIGHLDLLRVFQQTIRRAQLPVAYSQGFNPHMRLSFALPLPVGMESVNDYADIILKETLPFDEMIIRLNENAPNGLTITAAKEAVGSVAGITMAADYSLSVKTEPKAAKMSAASPEHFCCQPAANMRNDETDQTISDILNKTAIIIPKKTKSGIKDTDIRPDIYTLWQEENHVIMRLSAGSQRFLNPLTVAKMLKPDATNACLARLDLYTSDINPL